MQRIQKYLLVYLPFHATQQLLDYNNIYLIRLFLFFASRILWRAEGMWVEAFTQDTYCSKADSHLVNK